jgi:hypothetical protein
VIFKISKLSSADPGLNAGPLAPPFSAVSRDASDSPAGGLSPEWQGAQRAASMGCIWVAKSVGGAAETNEALESSASAITSRSGQHNVDDSE